MHRKFGTWVLLILPFVLVACGSASPAVVDDVSAPATGAPDVCSQQLDYEFLKIENAGRVTTLGEDFQFDTLGEQAARTRAENLFSAQDGFCGFEVPAALQEQLSQIGQLYAAGQQEQGQQALQALLDAIEAGQYVATGSLKTAMLRQQAGGDQARQQVRSYMTVAAQAQRWGDMQASDQAIDSAREAYSSWASDAVESASIKEALTIAAEAQLLGLDELSRDAINHATDLAIGDFIAAFNAFEPCASSEADARDLLDKAALAMLLGFDPIDYDFMAKLQHWSDIQQRRGKGENVPECDAWQIQMELKTSWEGGTHDIVWDGTFLVQPDGTLDGQGSGTIETHTQTPCVDLSTGSEFISTTDVTGTFTFRVVGVRQGSGEEAVFKLQLPAEVTVSGTDTCNPFEVDTYFPKYVIESINAAGGVEGYDMATDEVYLVVQAVDGATKSFETLIGPLTLSVYKLQPGG